MALLYIYIYWEFFRILDELVYISTMEIICPYVYPPTNMLMHMSDGSFSQFHQPNATKKTQEQILPTRRSSSTPVLMTIWRIPPTTNVASTHSPRHPHIKASDPFLTALPKPRRPASDPFLTALPKLRKPAMVKIEKRNWYGNGDKVKYDTN